MISFERVVFSIVGKHAGESIEQIFERKLADISELGKTFWMVSISSAVASAINDLIAEGETRALFLLSSGKARPAVSEQRAEGYLDRNGVKCTFPDNLSVVSGNINKNAYAFVLSEMEIYNDNTQKVDTCFFVDQVAKGDGSVKFGLGYSTIPCKMVDHSLEGMKSHERTVVAIAKINSCVKLV